MIFRIDGVRPDSADRGLRPARGGLFAEAIRPAALPRCAIERARSRLRNGAARTADLRSASLAGLLEVFASRDRSPARIAVKQGDRVILIPVDDITHCEAADNYVRVHAQGKKYLVRETMQAFERRLGSTFARIHRSAIVNLSRVHEVRPLISTATASCCSTTAPRLP